MAQGEPFGFEPRFQVESEGLAGKVNEGPVFGLKRGGDQFSELFRRSRACRYIGKTNVARGAGRCLAYGKQRELARVG